MCAGRRTCIQVFNYISMGIGEYPRKRGKFMKKILKRSLIALFLVLSMIVAVGIATSVSAATVDHSTCGEACLVVEGETTPKISGTLNSVFGYVNTTSTRTPLETKTYTITIHKSNETAIDVSTYVPSNMIIVTDAATAPTVTANVTENQGNYPYRGLFLTYSKSYSLTVTGINFDINSTSSSGSFLTLGSTTASTLVSNMTFTDVNVDVLSSDIVTLYQGNNRAQGQYNLTIKGTNANNKPTWTAKGGAGFIINTSEGSLTSGHNVHLLNFDLDMENVSVVAGLYNSRTGTLGTEADRATFNNVSFNFKNSDAAPFVSLLNTTHTTAYLDFTGGSTVNTNASPFVGASSVTATTLDITASSGTEFKSTNAALFNDFPCNLKLNLNGVKAGVAALFAADTNALNVDATFTNLQKADGATSPVSANIPNAAADSKLHLVECTADNITIDAAGLVNVALTGDDASKAAFEAVFDAKAVPSGDAEKQASSVAYFAYKNGGNRYYDTIKEAVAELYKFGATTNISGKDFYVLNIIGQSEAIDFDTQVAVKGNLKLVGEDDASVTSSLTSALFVVNEESGDLVVENVSFTLVNSLVALDDKSNGTHDLTFTSVDVNITGIAHIFYASASDAKATYNISIKGDADNDRAEWVAGTYAKPGYLIFSRGYTWNSGSNKYNSTMASQGTNSGTVNFYLNMENVNVQAGLFNASNGKLGSLGDNVDDPSDDNRAKFKNVDFKFSIGQGSNAASLVLLKEVKTTHVYLEFDKCYVNVGGRYFRGTDGFGCTVDIKAYNNTTFETAHASGALFYNRASTLKLDFNGVTLKAPKAIFGAYYNADAANAGHVASYILNLKNVTYNTGAMILQGAATKESYNLSATVDNLIKATTNPIAFAFDNALPGSTMYFANCLNTNLTLVKNDNITMTADADTMAQFSDIFVVVETPDGDTVKNSNHVAYFTDEHGTAYYYTSLKTAIEDAGKFAVQTNGVYTVTVCKNVTVEDEIVVVGSLRLVGSEKYTVDASFNKALLKVSDKTGDLTVENLIFTIGGLSRPASFIELADVMGTTTHNLTFTNVKVSSTMDIFYTTDVTAKGTYNITITGSKSDVWESSDAYGSLIGSRYHTDSGDLLNADSHQAGKPVSGKIDINLTVSNITLKAGIYQGHNGAINVDFTNVDIDTVWYLFVPVGTGYTNITAEFESCNVYMKGITAAGKGNRTKNNKVVITATDTRFENDGTVALLTNSCNIIEFTMNGGSIISTNALFGNNGTYSNKSAYNRFAVKLVGVEYAVAKLSSGANADTAFTSVYIEGLKKADGVNYAFNVNPYNANDGVCTITIVNCSSENVKLGEISPKFVVNVDNNSTVKVTNYITKEAWTSGTLTGYTYGFNLADIIADANKDKGTITLDQIANIVYNDKAHFLDHRDGETYYSYYSKIGADKIKALSFFSSANSISDKNTVNGKSIYVVILDGSDKYADLPALNANEYGIYVTESGDVYLYAWNDGALRVCVDYFVAALSANTELPKCFTFKAVANANWITEFAKPSGKLTASQILTKESVQETDNYVCRERPVCRSAMYKTKRNDT